MGAGTAASASARSPAPAARLRPTWPLTLLFAALPLWWLLGVWQIMFFVVAIPMAAYLMKRRSNEAPRGFGLWLLFVAWLVSGYLVLQVNAPGAVPGASAARYVTFSYRLGWYIVSTIVALYVLNTRRIVSTQRIVSAVAWLFVMLVGGGLIGLVAPTVSFPSVLQSMLPGGVANHPFVHSLVHVQFAQVHYFLSEPQARPSAPFAVTNEWGLTTALTLPFFVVAWWKRGGGWRIAMIPVLLGAVVTVISSLNRGVWASILVVLFFLLVREVARKNVRAVLTLVAVASIGVVLLMATPLGDLVAERFDNQHSNARRSSLGLLAVESTATGSPLVGFGTTRYVAGNFTSIAGGATDACPSCSPPPLGTQGQLWLLVFGGGFVALALFLAFFLYQLSINLRSRSPYAVASVCTLLVLLVTMPIYNSIGVALYVGLIAVGVLARESTHQPGRLEDLVSPVSRHLPTVLTTMAAACVIALATHQLAGSPTQASQRLLIPAADVTPVPGTREFSLDSEAQIVRSQPVMQAAARSLGLTPTSVSSALRISAEPNTRVLRLTFVHPDHNLARQGVEAVALAYLTERDRLVDAASADVVDRYTAREQALNDLFVQVYSRTETPALTSPLWDTLTELRRGAVQSANTILDAEDTQTGQTVSAVNVTRPDDPLMVRLASGLALGGVAGVLLVRLHERYRLTLASRRAGMAGAALPVVATVDVDLTAGQRALGSYLPIAGVVADPYRPTAVHIASMLDETLRSTGHRWGSRALLVVERRSRVHHIRELQRRCTEAGLEPVGLIVCGTARDGFSTRPGRDTSE